MNHTLHTDISTVTERARQLRAHYALQCSDLRARIERRINRVPIGLRDTKMGELMAQHQDSQTNINPPPSQSIARSPSRAQLDERPLPALPNPSKLPSPVKQLTMPSQKSRKRKSSAIHIASDKENNGSDTSNAGPDHLPVQKNAKRARTAAAATQPAPKRALSRTQKKPLKNNENPTGVLSPRSLNSRTLPRSPIKDKELLPPIPVRETSPLRQHQPPPQLSPQRPNSPLKSVSPFKVAMSGISAFAKRGYAAAGAAGAKLTRPLSREKEQNTLSGLGTTIPGPTSPAGRMLPPPRPALAALTSTNASATSIPMLSPQRTTSQTSMRSNVSAKSTTSSKGTVVTKTSRAVGTKKTAALGKAPVKKTTTTTAATRTKGKVVISGSTVSTLSPKSNGTGAGIKRSATTAARKVAAAASNKRAAAAVPAATGRVLRKRN